MKPFRAFVAPLLCLMFLLAGVAYADTAEEIQQKIEAKNAELQKLEGEIARFEKDLDVIGSSRKTLETELERLEVSRKKLATDIAITQNRIATTDLELDTLA